MKITSQNSPGFMTMIIKVGEVSQYLRPPHASRRPRSQGQNPGCFLRKGNKKDNKINMKAARFKKILTV